MSKILFVILAHDDKTSLIHLVENIKHYCDKTSIVLYNSGDDPTLGDGLDISLFPNPRRLYYAKVVRFFFDVFEWLHKSNIDFDYFINLETDMLFIKKGFERFIEESMQGVDYLGPDYQRFTSKKSRWRPIRSLRPELKRWYELLGFEYTHQAFSPAQVFSRKYIETLLNHPQYDDILRLISLNQSFTLQEVLLPTLPDFLKLNACSYPNALKPINRYRPYQGIPGIKRALSTPDAYFVHPVRREPDNEARIFIQSLQKQSEKLLDTP